jgi:hypothetical protein
MAHPATNLSVKPPPLLMIGVNAFSLALVGFGATLTAPISPPAWLWSLNAAAAASCLFSVGYWCRQANRRS